MVLMHFCVDMTSTLSLWKAFPLLNFRGFLLEYLNFVDLL
jgi:hypothetical protein